MQNLGIVAWSTVQADGFEERLAIQNSAIKMCSRFTIEQAAAPVGILD